MHCFTDKIANTSRGALAGTRINNNSSFTDNTKSGRLHHPGYDYYKSKVKVIRLE